MSEISEQQLQLLDSLYTERNAAGRPDGWRLLVEKLRELRRSIEAGEVAQIAGGTTLSSVLEFHAWAYDRFRLLEEGSDAWIGDDLS